MIRLLMTIAALYGVALLAQAHILTNEATLVGLLAVLVVGVGILRLVRLLFRVWLIL